MSPGPRPEKRSGKKVRSGTGREDRIRDRTHQLADRVTTLRLPPIHHENVTSALQGVEYPILLPENYPVSAVVDIGSNLGATAIYFLGLYPNSTIYCFEPSPKTFSLLKSNTEQFAGIRRFAFGLSNFEGLVDLFEGIHHSAQNSLFRTPMTIDEATPVRVRDAATVLGELGVQRVDIMKIDTEGCEVPILESILASGRLWPAQIALEYHSEEDRLQIDRLLTPRYFLATSRSLKVHRGQNRLRAQECFRRPRG